VAENEANKAAVVVVQANKAKPVAWSFKRPVPPPRVLQQRQLFLEEEKRWRDSR